MAYIVEQCKVLVTVVQTPEFLRRAKLVMSETEREALIDFLAANPEAGVSLGGGLRKLRVAREGGGKRSGYRAIHFYAPGRGLPVFLLAVFAKNDKANLTTAEAIQLQTIGDRIAATYGAKNGRSI